MNYNCSNKVLLFIHTFYLRENCVDGMQQLWLNVCDLHVYCSTLLEVHKQVLQQRDDCHTEIETLHRLSTPRFIHYRCYYMHDALCASAVYAMAVLLVARELRLLEQGTFPAKTFPERCYGSDVWYPKCDVLVPHVLPPIPYYSTTFYLLSPNLVL